MRIKKVVVKKISRPDQMPDIDIDIMANMRDGVKKYFSFKYGSDYVCYIGAYDRLKLKSSIKDYGSVLGLPFAYRNMITKSMENQLKWSWDDLIKHAVKNKQIEEFAQNHHKIVELIKFTMNQAKTASIHASAIIIVPKFDKEGKPKNIFTWMPVRRMLDKDGVEILVSEWEGKYIDKAGFLKEDILGLNQLDKFQNMRDLIKEYHGIEIVFEEIPLDDEKTYRHFSKGIVEDIFQFSGDGLRRFCKSARPNNIEHLIAMNALYRPGPMSSGAHEDFAKIINGKKEPQFDYGLEEVTEKTAGLYVYQEQIMRAVVVLGGLSLTEADEIRTVMKKFDKEKMLTYRTKFINGAVSKGCKEKEAVKIWDKLNKFSMYGFNRSHAASYSIMAYWSMYLKVHYPLAFWVTSLQMSSDDSIPYRIIEMNKYNPEFDISTVDVNHSIDNFVGDPNLKTIFWSFNKIKGIGGKLTDKLVSERTKSGKFLDLADFLTRMKGTGFGKNKTESLIVSGGFDKMYGGTAADRLGVMKKFYKELGENLPEEYQVPDADKEYFWIYRQKQLTGLGEIDFKKLISSRSLRMSKTFTSASKFKTLKKWDKATVAGIVDILRKKKAKNGNNYFTAKIRSNEDFLDVKIWSETADKYEQELIEGVSKKKIMVISGTVDDWGGENSLGTSKETKIIFI